MAIDHQHLKNRPFPPVRQHCAERDTLLYALSLGLGQDPLDPGILPSVYEGAPGGLQALPTLAVVLGYAGFWACEPDTGIDRVRVLHGEQCMRLHRPLPASGDIVGLSACHAPDATSWCSVTVMLSCLPPDHITAAAGQ